MQKSFLLTHHSLSMGYAIWFVMGGKKQYSGFTSNQPVPTQKLTGKTAAYDSSFTRVYVNAILSNCWLEKKFVCV